LLVELIIVVV